MNKGNFKTRGWSELLFTLGRILFHILFLLVGVLISSEAVTIWVLLFFPLVIWGIVQSCLGLRYRERVALSMISLFINIVWLIIPPIIIFFLIKGFFDQVKAM